MVVQIYKPTRDMVAVKPGPYSSDQIDNFFVSFIDHQANAKFCFDCGFQAGVELKRSDYEAAKEAHAHRHRMELEDLQTIIVKLRNELNAKTD